MPLAIKKKVIFYPEGTRNKTNKTIPLKYGGLNLIFNMGLIYCLVYFNFMGNNKTELTKKIMTNYEDKANQSNQSISVLKNNYI